jgi:sigma-B regulation protein RsbU (phosphoserine phosphatase)
MVTISTIAVALLALSAVLFINIFLIDQQITDTTETTSNRTEDEILMSVNYNNSKSASKIMQQALARMISSSEDYLTFVKIYASEISHEYGTEFSGDPIEYDYMSYSPETSSQTVENDRNTFRFLPTMFEEVKTNLPNTILQIAVTTENGVMFSDISLKGLHYDFRQRDFYVDVKNSQECKSSAPYIAYSTGKQVLSYSCPIYSDDEFMGVLAFDFLFDDLAKTIFQNDANLDNIFILSEDLSTIVPVMDDIESYDLFRSYDADIKKLLADAVKSPSVLQNVTIGNRYLEAAYVSMWKMPVLLVLEFEEHTGVASLVKNNMDSLSSDLQNIVESRLFVTLFIFLVSIVIVVLVGFFITRLRVNKLAQPVTDLVEKVRLIGEGILEQDFTNIDSNDEIAEIAKEVEKMANSLKEYIYNVEQKTSEEERVKAELTIAHRIQTSMVPERFVDETGRDISVSGVMRPAQQVGGDFYDYYFLDDKNFIITIGDVSGKGISAALFMALAMNFLKYEVAFLEKDESVAVAMSRVNERLAEGNDAAMFVTCFVAKVNIETGEVEYCNAGHNPPLKISADGEVTEISNNKKAEFPLAVLDNVTYTSETFTLDKGSGILLFTDGVTEAFNKEHEQYGISRLIEYLHNTFERTILNPGATINSLLSTIEEFADGETQSDDITALLFKRSRDAEVQWLRVLPVVEKFKPISRIISEDMLYNGFSEQSVSKAAIAFEELFVNVARYSGTDEILVEFFIQDDEYIIHIIDSGKEFNPITNETPDITSSVADRKIGGLGIFMAGNLLDEFSYAYKDGKNVTTLGVNRSE